jgi:hypothetical protein
MLAHVASAIRSRWPDVPRGQNIRSGASSEGMSLYTTQFIGECVETIVETLRLFRHHAELEPYVQQANLHEGRRRELSVLRRSLQNPVALETIVHTAQALKRPADLNASDVETWIRLAGNDARRG